MNWYRSGKFFSVLAIFVLAVTALPVALAQGQTDKIEIALLEQFGTDGTADFMVRFAEQANLSPAYDMSWEERGWFVYNTLTEVADRSQARAQAYLQGRGLAYQSFFSGNELYVSSGDLLAANALAGLPEVAYIRATRTYYIDPIVDETVSNVPEGPEALDWGLLDVHADQFWGTFGFQGDGIVVANIDTGVQYDHPALDQAYRCWPDPTDPECWEDPSNICGVGGACDNNGHGTHTMGTMVADDDPALLWQAGMAPNAQWIACKGCETNSCSETALNACADWIVAPNGNPNARPHIVNNSWGGDSCDNWYLGKVQAWRAAGVFPAFSAGNATGCNSLGSPGDYQESFGTTGHNSGRTHYYAQGPSCFGHEPYTKPNITAPAVGICSSIPTNAWSCGYSGTSMASPHTAGAVALLWSCDPGLIGDMTATFEALQDYADPPDPANPPCGVPPDNEGTYEDGYGYLNVYEAGLHFCTGVQLGFLDGYVYDSATNDPIQGANVNAVPSIQAVTDPNGYYTMSLVPGFYDVSASAIGYAQQTVSGVEVITGLVTSQDFYLDEIGQWQPGPSNPPFQYNRFDGVFNPVDELIYFPGGRTGGATHDRSIYTYDPLNDVWADTGCDMMQNAANVTAVLLEDDGTGRGEAIYLFGGYDAVAAVNIRDVQRYYPSEAGCVVETVTTDPYPDLAPNGLPVGAGGVAEVNGKAYVFGGWDSALPYFSNRTWEYDPAAAPGSRWTELAATLTPARAYINVAVQGGLIYALGGIVSYTGGDLVPTDVAEVYDPANPGAGWTAIASLPVATAEGRGFGFDVDTMGIQAPWTGKLYVAGGGDWPDQSAEVLEYDIASDTWNDAFPELITARRDHAGVFVPLCTEDPMDGLPGMWVFGGRITGDEPPFGNPEYFSFTCVLPGPPTAAFTADPTEGCAPLTVQFTDESVGEPPIESWVWEFGDGFTSTLQNPTHTYGISDTYVVLLTVESPSGTSSISDTITVRPLAQASFDYDPAAGLVPLTVYFSNTSMYAENPTWDFGDGFGDVGDYVNHTYDMTGTYYVTLTVDSPYGCGTAEAYGMVEVYTITIGPPRAAFVADPMEGCAPLEVAFDDQSAGDPPIMTWTWDLGDGTGYVFTETTDFTHTYDVSGTYVVLLTVESMSGTDSVSDTIVVHPLPQASFDYDPPAGQYPLTVYFSNTSMYAENPTWDFGDGFGDSGDYVSHTYAMTGTYYITLTVDSPYGCEPDQATAMVVVYESCDLVQIITATTTITGCEVAFSAEVTGTAPFEYLWEFGDGMTSTEVMPVHTYDATGVYTVTLHVWNCYGAGHAVWSFPVDVECAAYSIYLPLVFKAFTLP